ncbi:UDP-N-acetylglucosamine 2-epimerase [Streptococcus hillyeri]|uniref:UDP-N-acetylglucosamine 2-epimerase (Hydrolyzing) n=1 Tax=Streptococcus hillyeri TaxID=2282420 RepID=A0A3L9DTD9_9STRE|nr:UDP-N-acetylglucosamine 2-epimerase [Streptococcus hillyeri]RLY02422.1 UDP-N-acetylglucosamine 2-epimerase (hydrolyzing) [Streptococcus hillyeri]
MYNICLITGSRAEYGIMKPLIEKLWNDPECQLDIVATAMHMEEKYGMTYRVIENDGYVIAKKIFLDLKDTSKQTVTTAISTLQVALSSYFSENSYDLIVILGDRYEMLAVANVALIYNIPVCHLHGGEKTLGNFDEYIRHAITKMSHLHLASTEDYRQRIIQLGESPDKVINTGSLGVENALKLPKLHKGELEEQLGQALPNDYYVVLFHPVTLDDEQDAEAQIIALLSALEIFKESYIFIGSNSDTGSDLIMAQINRFLKKHKGSSLYRSLTTQQYHSLIRHSKGLIGNSSSGLIEVPSLEKPTLNIGDRQKGRLHGPSVIDVPVEQDAILKGLQQLNTIKIFWNPYEKENSSQLAYKAIKKALIDGITTAKDFYDVKGECE